MSSNVTYWDFVVIDESLTMELQAKVSPIEFDYLEYFFLRYIEFKQQKELSFTRARKYLSIVSTGAP